MSTVPPSATDSESKPLPRDFTTLWVLQDYQRLLKEQHGYSSFVESCSKCKEIRRVQVLLEIEEQRSALSETPQSSFKDWWNSSLGAEAFKRGDILEVASMAWNASAVSATLPKAVWLVLKHYSYEGDDVIAVVETEEEAKRIAERLETQISAGESGADKSIVQRWEIGEETLT